MTIDEIKIELAKQGAIGLVWTTEDVRAVRNDLTEQQAMLVLLRLDFEHDADMVERRGVSWDTIAEAAERHYPRVMAEA